jgi:innexin
VPEHREVPLSNEKRREATLKYYQWIPLLILLQAVGFMTPRLIWRAFHDHLGLPLDHVLAGIAQIDGQNDTGR